MCVHSCICTLCAYIYLLSKCTGHVDITNEDVIIFIRNLKKAHILVLTGSPQMIFVTSSSESAPALTILFRRVPLIVDPLRMVC